MPQVTEEAVLGALRNVKDPDLQMNVVSLGFIRDLVIQDARVSFTLELTTPACPAKGLLERQARDEVLKVPGVRDVHVRMTARVRAAAAQDGESPLIKNTIAVSSGKGGVGKSTVAVNLALALHQAGCAVGLLDADITGPNIPLMMGAQGRPGMFQSRIIPVVSHGVRLISFAFFLQQGEAAILRGPMLSSSIKQFLFDVEWGALDYLVIDLPPGTGDAQLTLSQAIPLTGALMVTTPQEVSLLDVRKGIDMFKHLRVPILGVVENMSYYVCPHGERVNIFGEGGGRRLADEYRVSLLGQIPLDPETRRAGDDGLPIVMRAPESAQAEAFRGLAGAVAARVSTLAFTRLPLLTIS
ncbi:MAG: Mrp/NBP35 family ATP-binding protein [Candidatus Methylomirabilales bacterium]